jgi:hypothetical protein
MNSRIRRLGNLRLIVLSTIVIGFIIGLSAWAGTNDYTVRVHQVGVDGRDATLNCVSSDPCAGKILISRNQEGLRSEELVCHLSDGLAIITLLLDETLYPNFIRFIPIEMNNQSFGYRKITISQGSVLQNPVLRPRRDDDVELEILIVADSKQ